MNLKYKKNSIFERILSCLKRRTGLEEDLEDTQTQVEVGAVLDLEFHTGVYGAWVSVGGVKERRGAWFWDNPEGVCATTAVVTVISCYFIYSRIIVLVKEYIASYL